MVCIFCYRKLERFLKVWHSIVKAVDKLVILPFNLLVEIDLSVFPLNRRGLRGIVINIINAQTNIKNMDNKEKYDKYTQCTCPDKLEPNTGVPKVSKEEAKAECKHEKTILNDKEDFIFCATCGKRWISEDEDEDDEFCSIRGIDSVPVPTLTDRDPGWGKVAC